ncbi:MAG: hypothetical protein WCC95_22635 [Candidatus Sulfotelmatobacter sp.]
MATVVTGSEVIATPTGVLGVTVTRISAVELIPTGGGTPVLTIRTIKIS